MEKTNPQAAAQEQAAPQQEIFSPIVRPTETTEYLMSPIGQEVKKFELTQRKAMMFSNSTMVPPSFRGPSNLGNCVIALEMADRLGCNPLMLMQNMSVIHNIPSLSAQMKIALFESTGKYQNVEYETVGQPNTTTWGMRAYTFRSSDVKRERPVYGPTITLKMATDEKWGDKWRTIPEKMLMYRSASWMIDVVDPGVVFGLKTTDELEDIVDYQEVADGTFQPISFEPQEAPKPAPEAPKSTPRPEKEIVPPSKEDLFQ